MFKANMGDRFYDERNGRYLTVDGVGCDPTVRSCYVEEVTADGDLELTGRGLFKLYELQRMQREGV